MKLIAVAGSKVINDDFQLKHWPRRILRHFLSSETIHNYTLQLATQLSQEGHGYYTNLGSQYSPKKQTMPIEWFGEGVKLPLKIEGISVLRNMRKWWNLYLDPNIWIFHRLKSVERIIQER